MRDSRKAKSLLPLVVYLEHLMLENGLADAPNLVEDVFDRVLLRLKSRYKSTTMNKKGDSEIMITREKYNQIVASLEGMSYNDWEKFKRHIDSNFSAKQRKLESQLRIDTVEELWEPFSPLISD